MEQQIYGRPEFEPNVYTPEIAPEPVAEQPRYRLPSYGAVDTGGPSLRLLDMDPELRLKKLKAEAQAKNAEKKRQTDRIVSPIIQEDLTQATAHERELQAELEKTRQALEQPYQRPGMDQYDMIAAGIAGLAGGAQGFNQATQGAYQRSDQQYDQNYQVQRQNAQLDYQQAQSDLEQSRRRIDSLKSAYINAVANDDNFERNLVLQELKVEADKEAALQKHANDMEIQQQINYRAEIRDPAKVAAYKALGATKEGRVQLMVLAGLDKDAKAAVDQLTIEELNKMAQTDLTKAKTQTENDTRAGKVNERLLKNQLKEFELKYADQYYKNRNKKQVVDIAHVEEKTRLLPESIRLSAGRLRIAEILAENSLGNTAFDNELAAWKARTQPEVQGHIARVKKIEDRMAEIRQEIEDTSDEDKAEELTVELNSLSRGRANVVARLDALAEKVPVPPAKVSGGGSGTGATQPGGTYGKDTGWHKDVAEWVAKQGFKPGAGFNPGRHNKGSQHDYGDALDVSVQGKTPAQIEAFMKEALRMGWSVRDERTKPAGQKVWGGPHIHLSRPKDGVPTRSGGGGRAPAPKNDPKPAPKGGTQTVNVSGTPVKVKTR